MDFKKVSNSMACEGVSIGKKADEAPKVFGLIEQIKAQLILTGQTLENESATLNLVDMQIEGEGESVCNSKEIKPCLSLVSELEDILFTVRITNSKSLENYNRLVRNFGSYN